MFENKIIRNILILQIIGFLLGLIFSKYTIVDGFEHLRMSWLVSQGYVPYRDFFEHHHPLLWYIYLPFTVLLPHNIMLVFYVSRVFSLAMSVFMLWVICKIIERYLGGRNIIPYFLVLILAFYPSWWAFTVLKPEILARPLYFLGLYLFFRYAETLKTKYLVWTGLAFTVAFLTIQNIVFSIIPLIIPLLYLWGKKKKKVGKDILLSAIVPLVIIGVFIGLLYFSGTLQRYYELCWLFNAKLFAILHYTSKSLFVYWIIPMILGIWAWGYQIQHKQSSFYMNTVGLLLCSEIVQRLCTKAVYNHYFVLIFIFISILCAPVFAKIKKQFVLQLCYILLITVLSVSLLCLYTDNNLEDMKEYRQVNCNPDNTLANLHFSIINVWEPKRSYYVMFVGMAMLDDFLFKRYPDYDVNKDFEENNIKYINWFGGSDDKLGFEEFSGFNVSDNFFERFNVRKEIWDKYERIYENLWQRKDTVSINDEAMKK